MCSGPTRGVTLFTRLRRIVAAAAVLSVFVTLTAASPTIETPAQAQAAPPVRDTDAHAERLWQLQLQRAARNASYSAVGTVETRTVAADTPTRSQPRKEPKKAEPSKKPAATKPAKPTAKPSAKPAQQPVRASGNMQAVVNYALAQRGKPYKWGAAGPAAFDCSGLVQASYLRAGIRLPHQSEQIRNRGTVVARANWYPGMVLWRPGHVGIFLGGNTMIHASKPGKPVAVVTIYGSFTGLRVG